MLHYPNSLERIRKEVNDIDQDEIDLSNAKDMPFTEAVILEVQRLASVLPISPPRLVQSENLSTIIFIFSKKKLSTSRVQTSDLSQMKDLIILLSRIFLYF